MWMNLVKLLDPSEPQFLNIFFVTIPKLFTCKRKCKKGRKFVTGNEKDKISWP